VKLRINHVTKQFQGKTAVDDFTLDLSCGICGLIGENGAGKTTLMNIICAIMEPNTGSILLEGLDVKKMGESYRTQIGYLPQDFGVAPEFAVLDYLEYISLVKGLTAKEGHKRSEELMEYLSLHDDRKRRVCQLSGGTRRRVGIAQALLNDPKILILDEPTTGLDPGERAKFRQMIGNLAKERIVLISTHIVSDIEALSTRNAIMKNGKLAACGTTDELTEPLLGKTWEIKIRSNDMEVFAKEHYVLNMRNSDDGTFSVRFIHENAVHGAAPVHPCLEDVFLWKYLA